MRIQIVYLVYTTCIRMVYKLYTMGRQSLYNYLGIGKKDEKWRFSVCENAVSVGHIH